MVRRGVGARLRACLTLTAPGAFAFGSLQWFEIDIH
jgi:hypothetical protein